MIKEEKKYTYGNRLKYHFAAFLSFFLSLTIERYVPSIMIRYDDTRSRK